MRRRLVTVLVAVFILGAFAPLATAAPDGDEYPLAVIVYDYTGRVDQVVVDPDGSQPYPWTWGGSSFENDMSGQLEITCYGPNCVITDGPEVFPERALTTGPTISIDASEFNGVDDCTQLGADGYDGGGPGTFNYQLSATHTGVTGLFWIEEDYGPACGNAYLKNRQDFSGSFVSGPGCVFSVGGCSWADLGLVDPNAPEEEDVVEEEVVDEEGVGVVEPVEDPVEQEGLEDGVGLDPVWWTPGYAAC